MGLFNGLLLTSLLCKSDPLRIMRIDESSPAPLSFVAPESMPLSPLPLSDAGGLYLSLGLDRSFRQVSVSALPPVYLILSPFHGNFPAQVASSRLWKPCWSWPCFCSALGWLFRYLSVILLLLPFSSMEFETVPRNTILPAPADLTESPSYRCVLSTAGYCLLAKGLRMFPSGISPVKETLGFLIRANVSLPFYYSPALCSSNLRPSSSLSGRCPFQTFDSAIVKS